MHYNHTQQGTLMRAMIIFLLALFGFIASQDDLDQGVIVIMVVVIAIVGSFTSLTVTIDEAYLRIKFGRGIYSKRFALGEIATVEAKQNRWYYGRGIRYRRWPCMVIYNISGFDAVEITMKNGKKYRIGTDEPDVLETMLRQAIG